MEVKLHIQVGANISKHRVILYLIIAKMILDAAVIIFVIRGRESRGGQHLCHSGVLQHRPDDLCDRGDACDARDLSGEREAEVLVGDIDGSDDDGSVDDDQGAMNAIHQFADALFGAGWLARASRFVSELEG